LHRSGSDPDRKWNFLQPGRTALATRNIHHRIRETRALLQQSTIKCIHRTDGSPLNEFTVWTMRSHLATHIKDDAPHKAVDACDQWVDYYCGAVDIATPATQLPSANAHNSRYPFFTGALPLKKRVPPDCDSIISPVHKSQERSRTDLGYSPRALASSLSYRQRVNHCLHSKFEISSVPALSPFPARETATATILAVFSEFIGLSIKQRAAWSTSQWMSLVAVDIPWHTQMHLMHSAFVFHIRWNGSCLLSNLTGRN
jgi:hypothetical protein